MLLCLILALLCLPLLHGFAGTSLVPNWRSCRILGLVGYAFPRPTLPEYKTIPTKRRAHRARRVKVGRFRYITI